MDLIQLGFESAIDFSNELVDKRINNHSHLYKFFDDFGEIYQREKKKLPYHINIIDELRADENAHSRILAKFLMHNNSIDDKHDILKSFIDYIVVKKKDKKKFRNIVVNNPILTVEKKRIDLWIRDTSYAIILENKVRNAIDQDRQIERYIDATKEQGYKKENIYVLYMPPTYEKEPEEKSWGAYKESDIRSERYLKLSFRDDILPWLKTYVLPNTRVKEKLLLSSLEQYIDYLEGKFSLRTINNKMNMKLQEFIKEKLEITDDNSKEALEKISIKIEEVNNALTQLNLLKDSIKAKYFNDQFEKWKECLTHDIESYDIKSDNIINDWSMDGKYNYLGVKIVADGISFSLLIGYDTQSIYYGISKHYATEIKDNRFDFKEIIKDFGFIEDELWYGYAYTSFENAYERLKKLIERIINKRMFGIINNL